METRVAIAAIVVENPASIEQMNRILHEYRAYIIGRMGIPYPSRQISLISVAMDAPTNIISALSGKLGNIPGLSVKTVYSKRTTPKKEG
ncbi:MAG: iron-only hydrogenase system regulator [Eubacteriales bacterium]|nr:iron-only hydrogenase system regulator [Eubacteriales bacterium]